MLFQGPPNGAPCRSLNEEIAAGLGRFSRSPERNREEEKRSERRWTADADATGSNVQRCWSPPRQQQTERGEARFIDSIAAVVETDATDVEEQGESGRDIAHWEFLSKIMKWKMDSYNIGHLNSFFRIGCCVKQKSGA